jgi:hypothetical protein
MNKVQKMLLKFADECVKAANEAEHMFDEPEPAITIKKSGETWVARYDDVDYLFKGINAGMPSLLNEIGCVLDSWRPILSITITDEIAKLRPMVVWYDDVVKLVSVEKNGWCSMIDNCGTGEVVLDNIRLATVQDLP